MPRKKTVWKRQLIVMLICKPDRRRILDHTKEHLEKSAKTKDIACKSIELDTRKAASTEEAEALKEMILWLEDGRLYIVGHGDWSNQKIGCWDAATVAKLVGVEGAQFPLASLTGCRTGRDKISEENPRQAMPLGVYVANSMDSFASQFHRSLGEDHKLKIDVYARVFGTQADKSPTVLTMWDDILDIEPDEDKAEGLFGVGDMVDNKKLRFFWKGELQQREWVMRGTGAEAVF